MTIETITYYSANAKPNEVWIAYVMLPSGQRWNVAAFGETEQIAIDKIVSCYESAKAKVDLAFKNDFGEKDQWSKDDISKMSGRGSHFVGKVWMIHSFTRAKIRIDAALVAEHEKLGWERGGPRSK